MTHKNAIGRPNKVNYTVMSKLEDALRYGASVSEACAYAGISRDTFYRHFRNEKVFSQKIKTARTNLLYPLRFDRIVACDF
jgi:AcrR family transcriptional regulator